MATMVGHRTYHSCFAVGKSLPALKEAKVTLLRLEKNYAATDSEELLSAKGIESNNFE